MRPVDSEFAQSVPTIRFIVSPRLPGPSCQRDGCQQYRRPIRTAAKVMTTSKMAGLLAFSVFFVARELMMGQKRCGAMTRQRIGAIRRAFSVRYYRSLL